MLEFEVLDVFTDAPFEGNPLAVVLGADGLADGQLQALAREFNLSETAFPLPPTEQERARGVDYRLRIFTPVRELPFAGHPSVGTAWLLAARGAVAPGRVVQACGAGDLPLDVAPDLGRVTLTGGEPRLGDEVDPAPLLAALGLVEADLTGPAPRVAGTGLDYCHVGVHPEALARVEVDPRGLAALGDLAGVYLYAWPRLEGGVVRARMFAPDLGVPEDPATGSAALGLAVHAVAADLLADSGTDSMVVLQGVEMGRPSMLHVEVDAEGGRAVRARVAGDVVRASTGEVAVPPA